MEKQEVKEYFSKIKAKNEEVNRMMLLNGAKGALMKSGVEVGRDKDVVAGVSIEFTKNGDMFKLIVVTEGMDSEVLKVHLEDEQGTMIASVVKEGVIDLVMIREATFEALHKAGIRRESETTKQGVKDFLQRRIRDRKDDVDEEPITTKTKPSKIRQRADGFNDIVKDALNTMGDSEVNRTKPEGQEENSVNEQEDEEEAVIGAIKEMGERDLSKTKDAGALIQMLKLPLFSDIEVANEFQALLNAALTEIWDSMDLESADEGKEENIFSQRDLEVMARRTASAVERILPGIVTEIQDNTKLLLNGDEVPSKDVNVNAGGDIVDPDHFQFRIYPSDNMVSVDLYLPMAQEPESGFYLDGRHADYLTLVEESLEEAGII